MISQPQEAVGGPSRACDEAAPSAQAVGAGGAWSGTEMRLCCVGCGRWWRMTCRFCGMSHGLPRMLRRFWGNLNLPHRNTKRWLLNQC